MDTIGSYCEITRAGCALTSMHDARIQQRYTGGGGVGGGLGERKRKIVVLKIKT